MHRLYETEEITVFWDSEKCRHAKECVTGSPEVFEFGRRPWIDLKRGDTPKIWQTVSRCPSGALTVTYNHDVTVRCDEANCRSIALCNDEIIGECDYEGSDGSWCIYHTHVLPAYGGKNIAKRLVFCLAEAAERRGFSIRATCSYALKVL